MLQGGYLLELGKDNSKFRFILIVLIAKHIIKALQFLYSHRNFAIKSCTKPAATRLLRNRA